MVGAGLAAVLLKSSVAVCATVGSAPGPGSVTVTVNVLLFGCSAAMPAASSVIWRPAVPFAAGSRSSVGCEVVDLHEDRSVVDHLLDVSR